MDSRQACCASCHGHGPVQVCNSERTSLESGAGTLRYRWVNRTANAANANVSGSCAGAAAAASAADAGGCIKVIQAAPYSHVVLTLTFRDGKPPGAAGPQIFDVSVLPTHPDVAWLLEEADLASWRLWPSANASQSAAAIVSANYMVRA
jgi:hypothetical protein